MSTLVIRLAPGSMHTALDYVLVDARGQATDSGQAQPALLPRAQRVVGVWPAEQLTLLALQLPAVPPARLRAALAGALEDRLLADPAAQHLAAGPREADGSVRLACACSREPLAAAIHSLAQAGREPAALVPEPALLAPGEAWLQAAPEGMRLLWRDVEGEAAWMHLPRDAAQPALLPSPTRVLAEPALQETVTRWFGSGVDTVALTPAQGLARAAESAWNLRQFDLAPQAAMQRGAAGLARQLATPAWRRAGLVAAALALVQIVGLNLYAMKLRHERSALQSQVQTVVSQALPGAPAILDARLQMQRALDTARLRAGKPASTSIEVLMGAAAQVLPSDASIGKLEYTPGQLKLAVAPTLASAAQARCAVLGLTCKADGGMLTIGAPG
ncbi:type II secretion system protein GspL [Thiomonas sp. FB-Cd]|uniref:type II secretion system protein GspL n=1 Tax=Thiomonas sp. FB-Cd TaxID=1158292 RepID=UPI0004DFB053|nr:type II secretion system protein GspL [Thiomonas sp. FB-Cd]